VPRTPTHHLRPAHHDKFTLPVLTELGFPPERIISSLEMRMECG